MKAANCCILGSLLILSLSFPSLGNASTVYLNANFDDKTIDARVGQGGAAAGEPSYIDFEAGGAVRSTPMPTPSLEMLKGSDCCWQTIGFSLLDGVKLTTGIVVVAANIWIADSAGATGDHRFIIRQWHPEPFVILEIYFNCDGTIRIADANGYLATVGQFETGMTIPVGINLDWDTSTPSWRDNPGSPYCAEPLSQDP